MANYKNLLALGLILCGLNFAQSPAAPQLTGRVSDQQGAALHDAQLTLRNVLTGAAREAKSDGSGNYAFTDVAPGQYVLTASATGLAAGTRSVEVKSNEPFPTADIQLPLATVQQSVTVISGSRVEELQQDSPLPIEAVGRQQIIRTGFENAADVLGEIPGIVTRNNASFSGASQEQIDGIASQDVLVLQDGLPLAGARGIKSGIIDLDQQDVGKLQRIEVVRGASSALFGTDAVGGAINLITREPTEPFQLDARISGGTLGLLDSGLDLGAHWKNLAVFGDFESHAIGSYTLLPGDESTIGAADQRFDGLFKLDYSFNPKFSLNFSASGYHNEATGKNTDFSGLASSGYDRAKNFDSTQNYALVANITPTASTAIQGRLYESRYDENSYQSPLDANGNLGAEMDYGDLHEKYRRMDATISQQFGSWQMLQGGDEWVQDQYRGLNRLVGDDSGQQVTTNDFWLQDRIQVGRKLLVTLGGRYNHHSLYGSHLVPKVGAVYRLNDHWTIRAAYGKGFRSPTIGELYYRLLHPEYFYQVIGNPTLRPESSESYSFGGDYQHRRFTIGVSLYRNNLSHLINYVFAGFPTSTARLQTLLAGYGVPSSFGAEPFLATYLYTNVDSAYTQGFNVKASYLVSQKLRIDGSYSYLDPYDVTNHQILTERSRHQGYLKAEYALNRWGLIANIRANFFGSWLVDSTSGLREPSYAIWRVYASKNLVHGLQLYAAIDNLTNSKDSLLNQNPPSYDRTDYGRTFRVGMRYAFPKNKE